jgi:hypothetical protein
MRQIYVSGKWIEGLPIVSGTRYRHDTGGNGWCYGVYIADAEQAAVDMRVTRLGFLDRFTDAEAVAIDLSSMGATLEAASIRRFVAKVNAAQYIDLAREDTISGVNALEQMGLIGEGRAVEILSPPVTDDERYEG